MHYSRDEEKVGRGVTAEARAAAAEAGGLDQYSDEASLVGAVLLS